MAAGLTQRALAARLQTSRVFVHKGEVCERREDVTEFLGWCVVCGADPDEAFRQSRRQRGSG